jgi:hypothetical protein
MPDIHRRATLLVTAVDDRFGTHRVMRPITLGKCVLWCLVGVGRVVVHGILRGAAAGANSFAVAEILTGTSGTRGARGPSTSSWASCLPAELVRGAASSDHHQQSVAVARRFSAYRPVGTASGSEVHAAAVGHTARHARQAIAEDGTWMIVEPNTAQRLEDNISNPVRRMFMAGSMIFCLPAALAQQGPHALGNHAGEHAIRDIVIGEGWSR